MIEQLFTSNTIPVLTSIDRYLPELTGINQYLQVHVARHVAHVTCPPPITNRPQLQSVGALCVSVAL